MFYLLTLMILFLKEFHFFSWLKKMIHGSKKYRKPYDCFFCLSLWVNILALLPILYFTNNIYYLNEFSLSILISKVIDLSWNKI